MTSPVAWAATGCSRQRPRRTRMVMRLVGSTGGRRVNGTTTGSPMVDAAAGLDRAGVVEGELGPHQPVVELARLDLQRLHVAGELLVAAPVGDLEDGVGLAVGRAVHEHDEVRLEGDGTAPGAASENLMPPRSIRVDGPVDLAEVDGVDEQGGEDLHAGATATRSARSVRQPARTLGRGGGP